MTSLDVNDDASIGGNLAVGDGTPDVTLDGEDTYVEGTLEVDGASRFDSALTLNSDATINAQGDLRLADSDSSNYVGFEAPATVDANLIWTLPAADGNSGELLKTNGSGALSWTTVSGTPSSDVVTLTTALTGAAAVDNYVFTYIIIRNKGGASNSARICCVGLRDAPKLCRKIYG